MSGNTGKRFVEAFQLAGGMVGALCAIAVLEWAFPAIPSMLGIRPRDWHGLVGVIFAPTLHASFGHLMANAIPLWVLLTLLFWDRHYLPGRTLALIWVASGLGTWLIGRGDSTHVGASSIIYGLVTYLVLAGLLMRSWRSVAIALLVVFLYGGIMFGVLPTHRQISWEGHLCGALAGIWAARRNHA